MLLFYAVSQLGQSCNDEDLDQFLLQLVQAINFEGEIGLSLQFMPLAKFLIERVCASAGYALMTNFYWYVKVESENDRRKGKKYQYK